MVRAGVIAQIEIIRPSVVVALGERALRSALFGFGVAARPFRSEVADAEGTLLPNGVRVFAVYHCGARTLNTHRGLEAQIKHSARIRRFMALAGYDHRLSLCQVDVSLTQVFDRPVQGRHFFEAVIRDNLDLGRPDRVGLVFPAKITKATPAPTYGYRPRVITDGVEPSLHVEYKRSHVKQYLKEQQALRTETTINDPTDFYVRKAVGQLTYLRDLGQTVNRKLLEAARISHQGVLTQDALDRLQRPTILDTQRAPALRFGDARVIALCQALTRFAHLVHGFRNRDLRSRVDGLLGSPSSAAQMTYDLRRLRLKGLTHRLPGTHRYTATTYGLKVAFFHSRLYLRVLRPQWPALADPDDALPRPLWAVLDQLDLEIRKLQEDAALAA